MAPADRPWVSVNFAVTWDGRISTRSHTPSDFSSPADKHRLLELRALADAVMVGVRTAQADHMTMTLPEGPWTAQRAARGQAPQPLRVLLSRSGNVPEDLAVWQKAEGEVLVFTKEAMPDGLAGMLRQLWAAHGVRSLHCEGGGTIFRALLEEDLVDEIYLTLCPRIFGSREAPTLTGPLGEYLPRSTRCELVHMEVRGEECFLQYHVVRKG